VLSWQNCVIGDPLYRPFRTLGPGEHVGIRFTRLHQDLTARQNPLLSWAFLQLINFQLANGHDPVQLAAELQQNPALRDSGVLHEKLGDLYYQSGKLGDAMRAYDRTLKLELSPLQKIRVRLTLAQLQGLLGRETQALDQYDLLLRETPDYPDPLGIYRLMLPLAQQINAKDRIAQIQEQITRLASPPIPPTPVPPSPR
jgi:tetratricopeptide (TPR) repeat protein